MKTFDNTSKSILNAVCSSLLIVGMVLLHGCSAHTISGPDFDLNESPVAVLGAPVNAMPPSGGNITGEEEPPTPPMNGGSIEGGVAHNETGED